MITIIPYASSSAGNCYLLKRSNKYYLVECGVDKRNVIKYLLCNGKTIIDISGCFISHSHLDHSNCCKWVNEYMPIYSNSDVMGKFGLVGRTLHHNQAVMFDDMKVLPFEVNHGEALNFAYIFKDNEDTVLFATDLMSFNNDLSNIKFTKIYIECNYDDMKVDNILTFDRDNEMYKKYLRQINTHMSLSNLKAYLHSFDLSECKEIALLHASKFLLNKAKTKTDIEHEFKIRTYFAKEK